MTRIKLKYVQAFIDQKSGGVYHYFRRAGFPRVRLPGMPGSDQFMMAYRTALAGMPDDIGANRSKAGSVGAAVAAYFQSPEFKGLAAGTQDQRRSVLERLRNAHGHKPLALLPQKFIVLLLATMTPSNQRNWLKGLRGFMTFAKSREWITVDPTQGVKLAKLKSDGYHTWDEAEIAQYEAAHPLGSEAACARFAAQHGAAAGRCDPYGPPVYPRRRAHRAAREDPRDAGDSSAPQTASGARSGVHWSAHILGDPRRAAVHRRSLHQNLPRLGASSRTVA